MTVSLSRARLPLLAAALLLSPSLPSQTKPALAPASDTANPTQSFTRAAQPGGVALSPDGSTVAWTLGSRNATILHLSDVADPTKTRTITVEGATDCSSTSPIWSPDSSTLAFLSTCTTDKSHPSQEQIFLWSKSTNKTRQLTHLTGNLQQPAFSPDGKSIAFLFVENATRSAGALDAMKPWSGVIGEDGIEIQQVYAVEISSGGVRPLTPFDLHAYEFAWSPDSSQIAFVGANPPGENNWWVAKLYLQSVGAGPDQNRMDVAEYKRQHCKISPNTGCAVASDVGRPTVLFDPTTTTTPLHGLQIAVPRYSPDGKSIAFIGGLMSDQGSTGGDIYVIPTTGGEPTNITPNIDGTPVFEAWISDHTLSFVEDRSGHTLINAVNVNDKAIVPGAPLDLGEVSLSGGPIKDAISISNRIGNSKDRLVAFTTQGLNHPAEVYVYAATSTGIAPTQITHLNAATITHKVESIEWDNEGFHVQGWLTYPRNYDPAKKYPMIVSVHGGPSASAGPPRSFSWSDLGYFEFSPNPRGSFGQGEKFVQANVKDFGYGDLRDILTGVDAIEKKVSIDDHRLGLTGWSYGGFMTMFAVTQTHRFRAAVAGAGISDWLSYYGENSIDQWMLPFFGASVYDDPAVYAKSSAINFIKNVTTPTLVIVGDRDGECPAPQSFEFWHALRAEGVKTQLVVYPNEGHGFRNPEHIRDRTEREARWFAQYMPAD